MSVSAAASRSAPAFAIVLLSVAAFASAANMRVIDPLLIQLSAEFGVTVGAASIATTLFLCQRRVRAGARPVRRPLRQDAGGRHRLPRSRALLIGSALAVSLGMLAGTRFLTGVTSSAIIPLAIAWLGDNVGYEKRQATLARFLTGQTLGLMTGSAMGGALGDWLGWRAVFWVLSSDLCGGGVALFVVMRARPTSPGPANARRARW